MALPKKRGKWPAQMGNEESGLHKKTISPCGIQNEDGLDAKNRQSILLKNTLTGSTMDKFCRFCKTESASFARFQVRLPWRAGFWDKGMKKQVKKDNVAIITRAMEV